MVLYLYEKMNAIKTEVFKNKWLEVTVSPRGAELMSIRGLYTGIEYLWQGDKAYWERRSPLLFPTVGRLWNGTTRVGGHRYSIPMHGLVKDALFTVTRRGKDWLTLRLESSPRMHSAYPFPFRLDVTYRLRGNRLDVAWLVTNIGLREMPFHIGGHPGINFKDFNSEAEVHGYVDFGNQSRQIESATVGSDNCVATRRYALPLDDNGLLPMKAMLFDCDAEIIDGGQVERVALLDVKKRPYVTLTSAAPVTLLWSPEGKNAPFVCLEPWYGLCDSEGYVGEFENRPYMNFVAPRRKALLGYELRMDAEALPEALSRHRKGL